MPTYYNFGRERRAEADRTEVLLLTSLAPYRYATPAHETGDENFRKLIKRKPSVSMFMHGTRILH